MSQFKVFFIVLDSVSDNECSPDVLQQLEKFSSMLEKKNNNYLIISSPVNECLQSSENLSNSLKSNWCVIRELSNISPLNFDKNPPKVSLFPHQNPEFYPINAESIKKISTAYKDNLVFVVEKQTFNSIGVQGKMRTGKGMNLCDIEMKVNLKDENILPKISQNDGKVSFRVSLRMEIFEKLGLVLKRIQGVFKNIKKAANKVDEAGEKILDMLEVTESDESNYENQLITVSSILKKAEGVYKKLDSTIDDFENLALTPIETSEFIDQVKICKFVYDFYSGSWVLTLKNSSQSKIPNLSVYCLETNQKIHTFKVIQANSKASTSIKMPYQDFFYKNLFAAVTGTVVSSPFTIFPYRLSSLRKTGEQGLWLKVENWSIHSHGQVTIANTSSRKVWKLSTQVEYKSMIFEKIYWNITQDTTVFLMSENKCVSNQIVFSSDN